MLGDRQGSGSGTDSPVQELRHLPYYAESVRTSSARSGERLRAVSRGEEDRPGASLEARLHDVDLIGEAFEEQRVQHPQSRGALRRNDEPDPRDIGGAL